MFHVKHEHLRHVRDSGMAAVYPTGTVVGFNGNRWPGISWPPDVGDRENGWLHLQNVARAEAASKPGVRVKVYGYRAPHGWAYTIGDKTCREYAWRPGVCPTLPDEIERLNRLDRVADRTHPYPPAADDGRW